MKIKAAVVFEKSGKFNIEQIEIGEPNDDEALIRIVAVGMCHTDLGAREQHLPIPLPGVFGHEGAGVVEKVGARVKKVKPGDHVALSWSSCGTCDSCKAGADAHCADFFLQNFSGGRPDGSTTLKKDDQTIYGSIFGQSSFAEYALANERNIVKVRDDIPLDILAPLGCGVLTGAGAVMNTFHPKAGSSIAVFGAGTVGMSAIIAATVVGCSTIIAVDINEKRLELSKQFGATHTVNASREDPIEAVRAITGGGAQYTLECVGNPEVFRQAVESLPLGGVCGLVGVAPFGTQASLDMQTILNGRTIKGIIEGDAVPDLFIPKIIELYRQGRFPFDKLITYYPFEEINKAAEDMEKGIVIKPVLRP